MTLDRDIRAERTVIWESIVEMLRSKGNLAGQRRGDQATYNKPLQDALKLVASERRHFFATKSVFSSS